MKIVIFDLDNTLIDTGNLEELRNNRDWNNTSKNLNKSIFLPEMKKFYKFLLNNGYKIIIVTSGPRFKYASHILKYHNINFMRLIGYEDTREHKPSPSPYIKALENIKPIDIEELFIIGDTKEDMLAAINLEKITDYKVTSKILINNNITNNEKIELRKLGCKIFSHEKISKEFKYLDSILKNNHIIENYYNLSPVEYNEFQNKIHYLSIFSYFSRKYFSTEKHKAYNISEFDEFIRNLILEFKTSGEHYKIFGVEIIQVLDYFKFNNKETIIIPVPSSKKEKYETRYKKLFNFLEENTEVINGYNFIQLVNDCEEAKNGNRDRKDFIIFPLEATFKFNLKEIKRIILFDDIITTGATIGKLKEQIEKILLQYKIELIVLTLGKTKVITQREKIYNLLNLFKEKE